MDDRSKEMFMAKSRPTNAQPEASKGGRLLQTHAPSRPLQDALRIATALNDGFGGGPAAPHQIAMAMDLSPTSSSWRVLTGAAVGYGLTDGAYNAPTISLTPLGRRCVAPTEEGEDRRARMEAALKPALMRDFFAKYNRSKFPPDKIVLNVLEHNYSVPRDRVGDLADTIKANGEFVGIVQTTKTGLFVALDPSVPTPRLQEVSQFEPDAADGAIETAVPLPLGVGTSQDPSATTSGPPALKDFRVFISHGKNKAIVEQVKIILSLSDVPFEVAVETETTAIPVPEKVFSAMRHCNAGLIIVSMDGEEPTDTAINDNVLIEIGAAFVLYNKRVVLLWDKRLPVPSNLQGLYRCEFEGGELSFAVGTKLARQVKSFKEA